MRKKPSASNSDRLFCVHLILSHSRTLSPEYDYNIMLFFFFSVLILFLFSVRSEILLIQNRSRINIANQVNSYLLRWFIAFLLNVCVCGIFSFEPYSGDDSFYFSFHLLKKRNFILPHDNSNYIVWNHWFMLNISPRADTLNSWIFICPSYSSIVQEYIFLNFQHRWISETHRHKSKSRKIKIILLVDFWCLWIIDLFYLTKNNNNNNWHSCLNLKVRRTEQLIDRCGIREKKIKHSAIFCWIQIFSGFFPQEHTHAPIILFLLVVVSFT